MRFARPCPVKQAGPLSFLIKRVEPGQARSVICTAGAVFSGPRTRQFSVAACFKKQPDGHNVDLAWQGQRFQTCTLACDPPNVSEKHFPNVQKHYLFGPAE